MQNIGRAMAGALSHRGPDGEGLWQDPDIPLLLGHRRLAILDLSPDGAQPMESFSGRYVIAFNGEVYNFRELRKELEGGEIKFRGRSDTEVMLAAFDVWGVNRALQKFDGMFAFVLWDRKDRVLHFARDRLGKKPLYIGWAGRSLVFGSELKALRAHPDFQADVNRDVLVSYMRFACVQAPYSIYKNVWQLQPGMRMTLEAALLRPGEDLSVRMESYWSPAEKIAEAKARPVTSEEQAIAEFEDILKTCVQQRMISDVPLGAFLSGGLDSSTIVALMQQSSPRPVKTFCIGFHEAGFDEAAYARDVAAHLGTEHHELYLTGQDALDVIPKLPDIYDEPFADASQIPTYMVSRFAREHVTVALSGDGGDEMLGGYVRHLVVPEMWKRAGWMPPALRRMAAKGIASLPPATINKFVPGKPRFGERLHKAAEFLAMDDAQAVYKTLAGLWLDPEGVVQGAKETRPVSLEDPVWRAQGLNFAEQLIYNDTVSYLPHDILTKVDRATMAVSLEARAPLLDRRVFEYVWRLPISMKIRKGRGKWLLRQVLGKYVPPEMFERPKQGFTVPIGEWLCGPLRDWAEDLLDEKRLQGDGYLDAGVIRSAWVEHLAGRGNHAYRLWNVLMFQSWHQRWR
jgi:asparagine synthase (glutamine-hydrolysing)